jgi:hypothetical protein
MGKLRTVLVLALLSALFIVAVPIGVKAEDTWVWGAIVSANCSPTVSTTPFALEYGREYRIVAQGAFASYDLTGYYNFVADAQYYTPVTGLPHYYVWDPSNTFPAPNGHSFLQINGMDVNWGPFSNGYTDFTGHEYEISYIGMGTPITFQIVDWIDGDCLHNYCKINVDIYEGPPVAVGETAWAYGGEEYATCFKHWSFKQWGWSNGPLGHGHYEFEIWAGAAKCNLAKGALVGTLEIDYFGSTAMVTYMMDGDWTMGMAQLYVDGDPLPKKDGEYTVAPGQFPYKYYVDGPTHTFMVTGLSGDIYVVAHADVFGPPL